MEVFIRRKDMKFYQMIPPQAKGEFEMIKDPKDLRERFNRDELLKLLKNLDGELNEDEQDIALRNLAAKCFTILENNPRRYNGRITKISKLRHMLRRGGTFDRKALADFAGYDERNVHIAMAQLRNPDRTDEPIFNIYNFKTKSYTIYDSQEDMVTARTMEG